MKVIPVKQLPEEEYYQKREGEITEACNHCGYPVPTDMVMCPNCGEYPLWEPHI